MLEAFGDAIPPELQAEYIRQRTAQESGWPLFIVDGMSDWDLDMFWALRGGQNGAAAHKAWVRSVRGK